VCRGRCGTGHDAGRVRAVDAGLCKGTVARLTAGYATLLLYRSFRDFPGGPITLIPQRQGCVIRFSSPLREGRGGAARPASMYVVRMKPFRLLLSPLFVLALSLPAAAEKLSLAELSRYLNGLTTAQAAFTQTNADGSQAKGMLYIKRPGRARFEYAPPERSLVMAGGGQVAIFDSKSNQPPEQYPLRRTPLNLILAPKVDLAQAKMVVGHDEVGNTTRVLAQDPKNPEYGTIELVFTANPTALRQWIITDDLGSQTSVELADLETGVDLSGFLFDITAERARQNR
jgi:outer membrane lipoprotein-sorting protein